MDYNEFCNKVREFAKKTDFTSNNDILDMVPSELRGTYLAAIVQGFDLKNSFSSLSYVQQLSRSLNISSEEVIENITELRRLFDHLKGHGQYSNNIAQAVELINETNSFDELMYISEHLEHRIEKYYKTLTPASPAFNTSWRKNCPACGTENRMISVLCKLCGWKPQ